MKTYSSTCLALALVCLAAIQGLATDLEIHESGGTVVLSWPLASSNDFYLQTASGLAAPFAWSNSVDPTTNGGNFSVINPASGTGALYRLQAWETLFDGTNITGLNSTTDSSFPSDSWFVANGALTSKVVANASYLMTTGNYTNFELRCLWKCETNGNSGIYYRWNGAAAIGPEYQLFDDANVNNPNYPTVYTNANRLIGALWNHIAPTNKTTRPTGQWNDCRIIVQGYHVTHWLNGNVILEYQINDPAFTSVFPQITNAHIAFQNMGTSDGGVVPGVVHFGSIKIRRLP